MEIYDQYIVNGVTVNLYDQDIYEVPILFIIWFNLFHVNNIDYVKASQTM